MWDTIIPVELKSNKILKLRNQKIEYPLRDVYNNLRGQNVKITLNAEIMPIVGYYYKVNSFSFVFNLSEIKDFNVFVPTFKMHAMMLL